MIKYVQTYFNIKIFKNKKLIIMLKEMQSNTGRIMPYISSKS